MIKYPTRVWEPCGTRVVLNRRGESEKITLFASRPVTAEDTNERLTTIAEFDSYAKGEKPDA